MTQKPKIQYVGQFYVYGSEAKALELQEQPRKPRFQLPEAVMEKIEKIYVDPVALVAIAVAVFMLVTMIVGVQQLQTDWEEYQSAVTRLHTLREANHTKTEALREAFSLTQVKAKALSMGMIPKAEAEHMTVTVILPEPEPQTTVLDNILWFVKGLFA